MPRLLRYRLVNVGDADATYPDVTFEPQGDHYCVIQPNGTGKSTAVKFLLHALVAGRDVDAGSGRALREYLVPEGRVAHVALEFGDEDRPGRKRIVVGLAVDRRAGENRKLHYVASLGARQQALFAADGLDVKRLPLAKRITTNGEDAVSWRPSSLEELEAFLWGQEAQHEDGEVHVFPPGRKWEDVSATLRRYGIDEAMWKEIAWLNRSESSFDALVKEHPTSARLVDGYLLPRVETEDSLTALRRHAESVREQLAHLPEIERSLEAFDRIERKLRQLYEALTQALELDGVAARRREAWRGTCARARGGMAAARETLRIEEVRVEVAKGHSGATEREWKSARLAHAAGALRDAHSQLSSRQAALSGAEVALTASVMRIDLVEAARHWAAERQAGGNAAGITRLIEARGSDSSERVGLRDEAAARLAARLESLIARQGGIVEQLLREVAHVKVAVSAARKALHSAQQEFAKHEAQQKIHRQWLDDARTALANAGFADLDALTKTLASANDEEQAAARAAESSEKAFASAGARRQNALIELERARHKEKDARATREQLEKTRLLEADKSAPAEEALARLELHDVHSEGPDALARIAARIDELDAESKVRAVSRSAVDEELAWFDRTGQLRPGADVVAVHAALEQAGIHAQHGPAWVRSVPWDADARIAQIRRQPGLATGFVLESADVDRVARNFDRIAERAVLRGPVFLFRRERLADAPQDDPACVVPAHASLDRFVDEAAMQTTIDRLRQQQVHLIGAESTAARSRQQAELDRTAIQGYLHDWPITRVTDLESDWVRGVATEKAAREDLSSSSTEVEAANEASIEAEAEHHKAGRRKQAAMARGSDLRRLADKWAEPWPQHEQGELEARERAAAASTELSTATIVAESQEAKATEIDTQVRDARDTSARLAERRRRLDVREAMRDDVDTPLEALEDNHDRAKAALAELDAVLALFEGQGQSERKRAEDEQALGERAARRLSDEARREAVEHSADDLWSAAIDLHAETAKQHHSVCQAAQTEKHGACEVAKADERHARKALEDLERELSMKAGDPGTTTGTVLKREMDEARGRCLDAQNRMADVEQLARLAGRLVEKIAAVLDATTVSEKGEAIASSLDEAGLAELATELRGAKAAADSAESASASAWSDERKTFSAMEEALADNEVLRSKLGGLSALRQAHAGGDWGDCLSQLAQHFAAVAYLREEARNEKAKLDEERERLVEDLVIAGDVLASRLKKIAPLSRVRVSGTLDVPMLAIELKRASDEGMRERGRKLFEEYREKVRKGEATPGEAMVSLLSARRLLRCVIDGDPEVRFLKPQLDMASARLVRWEEAVRWSGGESFVTGLVLLMALLAYRAHESTGDREASQPILLDNPVGKVNAPYLLRIAFDLARSNRFQLVAFTGIREPGVVAHFDRAVSVCKVPQGRRFLVVLDREDVLPEQAGRWAMNDFDTADLHVARDLDA